MKRPNLLSLLLILACSALALGCTTYKHRRFSDSGQPLESTSLYAPFLTKTTIAGLATKVTDVRGTNKYTRGVGVDAAEARADADGIAAMERLIGQAILSAAKGASPAP